MAAFARVPVSSTSAPPRAPGASGRTSRPTKPTRVRCFPRRRRKRNETPSAGHTRVCLRPRPPPRALAFHAPHVAQHARREYACRLRALAMPRLRLGANSTNTYSWHPADFFFSLQHAGALVSDCAAPIGRTRVGWVRNDGPSSSRRRVNTSTHERTTCTTITASYRSRSSSSPLPPTLQRAPPPPRRPPPRQRARSRARAPRRASCAASAAFASRASCATAARRWRATTSLGNAPTFRYECATFSSTSASCCSATRRARRGVERARPPNRRRAWRRRRRTPATTLCAPRRTARRGRAPRFPRGRTP